MKYKTLALCASMMAAQAFTTQAASVEAVNRQACVEEDRAPLVYDIINCFAGKNDLFAVRWIQV